MSKPVDAFKFGIRKYSTEYDQSMTSVNHPAASY